MNFNIYLDDETGERLKRAAEAAGESRNALIRQAIDEWLTRKGAAQWPEEVLQFEGLPSVSPFETHRGKLRHPAEDPLK